jgi:hypothetical protein
MYNTTVVAPHPVSLSVASSTILHRALLFRSVQSSWPSVAKSRLSITHVYFASLIFSDSFSKNFWSIVSFLDLFRLKIGLKFNVFPAIETVILDSTGEQRPSWVDASISLHGLDCLDRDPSDVHLYWAELTNQRPRGFVYLYYAGMENYSKARLVCLCNYTSGNHRPSCLVYLYYAGLVDRNSAMLSCSSWPERSHNVVTWFWW